MKLTAKRLENKRQRHNAKNEKVSCFMGWETREDQSRWWGRGWGQCFFPFTCFFCLPQHHIIGLAVKFSHHEFKRQEKSFDFLAHVLREKGNRTDRWSRLRFNSVKGDAHIRCETCITGWTRGNRRNMSIRGNGEKKRTDIHSWVNSCFTECFCHPVTH